MPGTFEAKAQCMNLGRESQNRQSKVSWIPTENKGVTIKWEKGEKRRVSFWSFSFAKDLGNQEYKASRVLRLQS